MKKLKVISILLAVMMALALASCGTNGQSAGSGGDDPSAAETVAGTEDGAGDDDDIGNAELGYVPDDLIGTWAEKMAHRGVITISKNSEEGKYDVSIDWSSSACEKCIWEMTAVPVGKGGALAYENGRYLIRTYSSETEYTDEVQYANGAGTFVLNSA